MWDSIDAKSRPIAEKIIPNFPPGFQTLNNIKKRPGFANNQNLDYYHLATADTIEELHDIFVKRSNIDASSVTVIQVFPTRKEGKTEEGCPMATSVLCRASLDDKILIIAKATTDGRLTTLGVVHWDLMDKEFSDAAYADLSSTVAEYGIEANRHCRQNKAKTCECKQEGGSFTFGCGIGPVGKQCKFFNSALWKEVPKFKLKNKPGCEERKEMVKEYMDILADEVAKPLKDLLPQCFTNMTAHPEASSCRLGNWEEGLPFAAGSVVADFSAHKHKDDKNMLLGVTAVVSLLREDKRDKIISYTKDMQVHILPFYSAFDNPDGIGGFGILLPHGSVLYEYARGEFHATTKLPSPSLKRPTRIAIVLFQHRHLNKPDHNSIRVNEKEDEIRLEELQAVRNGENRKQAMPMTLMDTKEGLLKVCDSNIINPGSLVGTDSKARILPLDQLQNNLLQLIRSNLNTSTKIKCMILMLGEWECQKEHLEIVVTKAMKSDLVAELKALRIIQLVFGGHVIAEDEENRAANGDMNLQAITNTSTDKNISSTGSKNEGNSWNSSNFDVKSEEDEEEDTDDEYNDDCPVCKESTNYGKTIQCETCDLWYHFFCVDVKDKDDVVISEDVPFFCQSCEKLPKRKKRPNKSSTSSLAKRLKVSTVGGRSSTLVHSFHENVPSFQSLQSLQNEGEEEMIDQQRRSKEEEEEANDGQSEMATVLKDEEKVNEESVKEEEEEQELEITNEKEAMTEVPSDNVPKSENQPSELEDVDIEANEASEETQHSIKAESNTNDSQDMFGEEELGEIKGEEMETEAKIRDVVEPEENKSSNNVEMKEEEPDIKNELLIKRSMRPNINFCEFTNGKKNVQVPLGEVNTLFTSLLNHLSAYFGKENINLDYWQAVEKDRRLVDEVLGELKKMVQKWASKNLINLGPLVLPDPVVLGAANEDKKSPKVDLESFCLFLPGRRDIKHGIPVLSKSNDECLWNSIAIAAFGDEGRAMEVKARTISYMASNEENFRADFLEVTRLKEGRNTDEIINELFWNACIRRKWSSVHARFAASVALRLEITLEHPRFDDKDDSIGFFNSRNPGFERSIKIFFTKHEDGTPYGGVGNWKGDHFVPVLECDAKFLRRYDQYVQKVLGKYPELIHLSHEDVAVKSELGQGSSGETITIEDEEDDKKGIIENEEKDEIEIMEEEEEEEVLVVETEIPERNKPRYDKNAIGTRRMAIEKLRNEDQTLKLLNKILPKCTVSKAPKKETWIVPKKNSIKIDNAKPLTTQTGRRLNGLRSRNNPTSKGGPQEQLIEFRSYDHVAKPVLATSYKENRRVSLRTRSQAANMEIMQVDGFDDEFEAEGGEIRSMKGVKEEEEEEEDQDSKSLIIIVEIVKKEKTSSSSLSSSSSVELPTESEVGSPDWGKVSL